MLLISVCASVKLLVSVMVGPWHVEMLKEILWCNDSRLMISALQLFIIDQQHI